MCLARPVTQPLNFEDIQARYDVEQLYQDSTVVTHVLYIYCIYRKSGMRRGMLMTVLQQYAQEQDVWWGKPGERYIQSSIILWLSIYI